MPNTSTNPNLKLTIKRKDGKVEYAIVRASYAPWKVGMRLFRGVVVAIVKEESN
jgi:hypothetical protein